MFSLAQLAQPEAKFSPADMKGQVWLLNVWASWCVACRQEHPLLVQLARKKVTQIVGLNYKDKPDAAKAWLAQWGDPYDLSVRDLDGRIGIDYGVYGVPETFVIDKNGVIRFKQISRSPRRYWQKKMLPLLEQLRRSGAAAWSKETGGSSAGAGGGGRARPTKQALDPLAQRRLVNCPPSCAASFANQSIAESNAELAVDLRNQINEQIKAGKSDREIIDFMTTRYGDFVLYQPAPFKAATALLWISPIALLLLAVFFFYRTLVSRRLHRRK